MVLSNRFFCRMRIKHLVDYSGYEVPAQFGYFDYQEK